MTGIATARLPAAILHSDSTRTDTADASTSADVDKNGEGTLAGSAEELDEKSMKQDLETGGALSAAEDVTRHRWCIFDPFNISPPAPPPPSMDDAETIRLATANWLSTLTFSWLTPLLVLGYKRELTAPDLPKMDETRQAAVLADRFEHHFDARRRQVEEWNRSLDDGTIRPTALRKMRWKLGSRIGVGRADGRRQVGIAMALSDTFFKEFWMAGLYKIIGDLAQTTSPLVTRQIILFVQESYNANRAGTAMPGIGRGIGFAVLLFVMQVVYSVFTANTFSRGGQVGILARGALIAASYRKAMRMSGKSRVEITNSKLVSHISTDISRIDFCSSFFHFSWTCIIQLIEVIVILLCTIGVTSLSGIAVVLACLPLQTWAMRKLFEGRQRSMVHTDARLKTITEFLAGIKIVKLFAWEEPLLARVSESRRKELNGIRSLLAIRSANQAIALSIPTLAAVIVFAVYSLTGHAQSPATIWTSISLLNLLRFPLMMLPNSLSTITDAASACQRLVPVFLAEDLPENSIQIVEESKVALDVKNASFEWEAGSKRATGRDKKTNKAVIETSGGDDETPFRLQDISLSVPKGSLVCVVGTVGSGKSSLLQGLVGEMRRTEGEVVFGGKIGYCAQQAWILNATIRENILFGRPLDEPRYWDCVRASALLADFEQLPSGDLTEVGEKGVVLSGGQKQRISIARLLYSDDAEIVLLDDPLSAVDAHVGAHLFNEAILGTLRSKTRILVTNAIHLLPEADSVVVIKEGRIVESGTFSELMRTGGEFSRFAKDHGMDQDIEQPKGEAEIIKPNSKQETGKAEIGKAGRPLQLKEDQASGAISFKVWRAYAKAANGYITIPLMLLSLILMGASQVLSNFALVWWQNGTFDLGQSERIGLYAGLGISTALFTFCVGISAVFLGTTASRNVHDSALKRLVGAPMSWFDTTPLGRHQSRLGKDVDGIDNRLNDSLRMVLATLVQIVASIVMIAIVYPLFLAPVAAVMFLIYSTSKFYRASARTIKRHDNTLRSFLYAWFGESLTGLVTIRAFHEQERFLRGTEKFIDIENRAYFLTVLNQRWLSIRVDTLGALLTFVVAIVAVAERTTIPSSKTGLILSVTLAVQQALTMMVRQVAEVENNMAGVERLVAYGEDLPQEAPARIRDASPPSGWPNRGGIKFEHIELRYRPELPPVLRDLSLEIKAGEKVGVVGRTGAGKSSLTLALYRMVELSRGRITIDGLDIATLGLAQLRERLAIIPQDPVLFNGTIRTNLDPFSVYDDARLWSALRRAWLVDRDRDPVGTSRSSSFSLDTKIEDEGANLSVGERSLVSLARALVKDAKVVVLDEATASVDLETDAKIQETIRSEFKDKTLLCIAHRINTIIAYDRILVLSAGRVEAFDSPLTLFNEGGEFHSLCIQSNITRADIVIVVSCPGKVLVAGGYLVLDQSHQGFVISTPSRFYTVVQELDHSATNAEGSQAAHEGGDHVRLSVRSPQFDDGVWEYRATRHGGEWRVDQTDSLGSSNPFVHLSLQATLQVATALSPSTKVRDLLITIVGSNDFYSQSREDTKPIPFAPLNCTIRNVHKTGLGSSAAMVTSLTSSLFLHWTAPTTSTSRTPETTQLMHNLAQYVHSLAQGKVGSGFDVSAAVYGSQVYKRFDVKCLGDLLDGDKTGESPSPSDALVRALSPEHNALWTSPATSASVSPFSLPPQLTLLLADVDAGSNTPSMVGKVLAWKRAEPEESARVWAELSRANDELKRDFDALRSEAQSSRETYAKTVDNLSNVKPSNWSATSPAFSRLTSTIVRIRNLMREMGQASGVPIEPPAQTKLLDAVSEIEGVVGAGVPGAGGYDAIWVLCLTPASEGSTTATQPRKSPLEKVEALLTSWKEMSVRPLSRNAWAQGSGRVGEGNERGLVREALDEVEGLGEAVERAKGQVAK
ncbi:hypothetical protein JCM11491_001395 [Sporobolomyces phaffii]